MKSTADLLKSYTLPVVKKRETLRGNFVTRFALKTGKPEGYIRYRLTGIPTADLFCLEKNADNYKGEWSKAFFGQLIPKDK